MRGLRLPAATDIVVLVGVVISAVSFFILPAVPDPYRASAGLAIGIVTIGLLLVFLSRQFRRELDRGGYQRTGGIGSHFKGTRRSVALRASTVQMILDNLARYLGNDIRDDTLIQTGYLVGKDWGVDLIDDCRQHGLNSLDERLALWSAYDASSGMGKFDFKVTPDGFGSVTLHNGFLSDLDGQCALDHLVAGYLRGTLERLLPTPLTVDVVNPRSDRHETVMFSIKPYSAPTVAPSPTE